MLSNMEARCRRPVRESSSPEKAKVAGSGVQTRLSINPIKKVQVFYYLSRNGQLEQPHFIEVTHFANQPLRLKDVIDRLTVLRGKALPSLYSWSCKRNYRSGYVWNDLSENDVIHPAEGAEYVLKGSELVEGCSGQVLQQIHLGNRQPVPEPNIQMKPRKPLAPCPVRELEDHQDYEDYDEVEEYEYEDGEKTSSTTPHSRCSRGVSTEELEEHKFSESTRIDSSRLSTESPIVPEQQSRGNDDGGSKRFTADEELPIESAPSRNSVLLQFIACGSSAISKTKNAPSFREPVKKTESLRKGVVCKIAGKQQVGEEDMIKYMSENPRFGNLQSEEKEYFSGSIVESMREVEPVMKRSNSYNEERRKKTEVGETRDGEMEEKREEGGGVKGKCIPRMMSSSSKQTKKP